MITDHLEPSSKLSIIKNIRSSFLFLESIDEPETETSTTVDVESPIASATAELESSIPSETAKPPPIPSHTKYCIGCSHEFSHRSAFFTSYSTNTSRNISYRTNREKST